MKENKIDFVIAWVDGNDPKWIQEKMKVLGKDYDKNNSASRFRDWDNLKYWFRGVEKNAPWVNKIYFITWGHVPPWLNVDNPKLVIVNHKDYIPKEYLPTFSSHVIELNMHRIKGLSEQFVYFNDDMFIIDKVYPEDFFKNGLPVDSAILTAVVPIENPIISHILINNTSVINKYFNMKKVIKENISGWFNWRYGIEQIRTLVLLMWNNFPGFKFNHISSSFLKETFIELWSKEYEILNNTCLHKFRDYRDVSQFLFKDWQIVNKKFYPMNINFGVYRELTENNETVIKDILNKKGKIICINDNDNVKNFQKAKKELNLAFEELYPDKSSFEK